MESHLPGLALNSYLLINEDCSIRKIAVNCLKHLVAIPEISKEAIDLNKLSVETLSSSSSMIYIKVVLFRSACWEFFATRNK